MAATGVEEVENFKMLLKHLNVPWLIRQAFLSIVSDFSVSCNHSLKVSFFAHANSNCGTPVFSLDCHGAMYKANFPCIDRVASWACGKVLTKSQYTFEAVDNSLRFSCDLIERNERFTISAHFDEKGDMITTWQIHSLVSGPVRHYFALQVQDTFLCNVAGQCRVSDFSNIPIFQFSIYFLFSNFQQMHTICMVHVHQFPLSSSNAMNIITAFLVTFMFFDKLLFVHDTY